MNKRDISNLAESIAKDLFILGGEPDSPTNRIEFKGNNDRGQGGFALEPLGEFIGERIEHHLNNT